MFSGRLVRGSRMLASGVVAAGVAVSPIPTTSKLSIYEEPEPEQQFLLEPPTQLENQIRIAREAVEGTYRDTNTILQGWVSRWIGVEHAVEKRIKSFKAPEESITPGALYIGVATLTGSILARSRGLPIRLILPPTFFFVSLNQFLPRTAANIGDYVSGLEHKYVPRAARFQDTAVAHSQMTWQMAKDRAEEGREAIGKSVFAAVDQVEVWTGLQLKNAIGWGRAAGQESLRVTEEVIEKTKEVVEEKSNKDKPSSGEKRLV
ncbi:hypothetical protein SCHPADRAFT_993396 [Schizopora paradoxa]|uniref:MICOS complex subunit n=1 Tax=Schizopora paradoxa TaxID=27342 RepID=A0A0H2S350_9AGAM|nr:hypothetical protein SCHPADRAFT_993396 [Schizopora paradoxa]